MVISRVGSIVTSTRELLNGPRRSAGLQRRSEGEGREGCGEDGGEMHFGIVLNRFRMVF